MSVTNKVFSGVMWSAVERFSVQGVQFIVSLFLARLLSPSEFGLIGLLNIFFAISNMLIDSGLTSALVRDQNRTEIDMSTLFFFNLLMSILMYLILFLLAPYISDFYNEPQLVLLLRIMSLSLIINSFVSIHLLKLNIAIDYKQLSKITLVSVILSGILGLVLANLGFGVWSLAAQNITKFVFSAILLIYYVKWNPMFVFSVQSFKKMFSFGSLMVFSGMIEVIYQNLYVVVIAKRFSTSELGFYTQANTLARFPSMTLMGILSRVSYPVLSNLQDDKLRLSSAYRRYLKMSAFVVFPLMVGLSCLARPFILVFLSEKWIQSVTILQILSLALLWHPIHSINVNLLKVLGQTNLILRIEIIKKVIGVVILIITIPMGIDTMCWGMLVSSLLSLFVNTYYTGTLIGLGFIIQMKDLLPILLCSSLMGLIIIFSLSFSLIPSIQLCIGFILGFVFYLAFSYIFKIEEFTVLKATLKKFIFKK